MGRIVARLKRGRRARQRVEAEYTWDQVARKTEAFYYDVLDRTS